MKLKGSTFISFMIINVMLSLGLLGFAVWVIVKVMQHFGVI